MLSNNVRYAHVMALSDKCQARDQLHCQWLKCIACIFSLSLLVTICDRLVVQVLKLRREVFHRLLGSLETMQNVWRYEALRMVGSRCGRGYLQTHRCTPSGSARPTQ